MKPFFFENPYSRHLSSSKPVFTHSQKFRDLGLQETVGPLVDTNLQSFISNFFLPPCQILLPKSFLYLSVIGNCSVCQHREENCSFVPTGEYFQFSDFTVVLAFYMIKYIR